MADNCCPSDVPPVVTGEYTPKGTYKEYAGLKTYLTGPETATVGVFVIYDIFGFYPQTIQGADILASRLNALVVIPDFFEGEPCDLRIFPFDTDEKKKILSTFISTKGNFKKNTTKINEVIGALKTVHNAVEHWAIMGFCWGGKITTLVSGENTQFAASIQVHPAMLDPTNASALTIPHLCLASADESPDAVAKYKEIVTKHTNPAVATHSSIESWTDMHHGWMAARAKLDEEKYRVGYQKGYARVAEFLSKIFDWKKSGSAL
ncbi:hypothetical protein BDZ91DRAFT_715292 [Kalaharituber pfeilii]|nr:hypothetical protein BDZ91DRAFT_715292 [Kalaharituber pfeilii]